MTCSPGVKGWRHAGARHRPRRATHRPRTWSLRIEIVLGGQGKCVAGGKGLVQCVVEQLIDVAIEMIAIERLGRIRRNGAPALSRNIGWRSEERRVGKEC